MKQMIAFALVALMAGGVTAQWEGDNLVGMFFSGDEFSSSTMCIQTPGAPFNAFIVTLNPEMESVSGYEVGISISDPSVFVLSVTGPNGWTNFGDNTNHLAGYGTPLPVENNAAVLSIMQLLYAGSDEVEIMFGPADPPSIPEHDGPVLADGANPDILVPCAYTTDPSLAGNVAWLNGICDPTPVESQSFSSVKAIFNN